MRPFTRRGSFTSPVLSLRGLKAHAVAHPPAAPREPRDRPPSRPATHRAARLYTDAVSYLFDGTLAGASTWAASVKTADWRLKNRPVGLLFAGDYRLVVVSDEHAFGLPVRFEAPARVLRVEAIPDGFRVDLQLKAPLRPRPNSIQPPPPPEAR